jgi:hypothetical protein
MLDFMVRHRPNAIILTNEVFVTFSFNKTSDWLDSLPRAELLDIHKIYLYVLKFDQKEMSHN